MACTPTRPDTRSWLPWHRQRLDAHCPAGPNPTVPFCPVHVCQTSSSGQTGPSPAGKIHSSAVPKFLTSRAVLGRAGEDAHPYAVLVRPPLTSIIKVSFRPPRPLGIPWLRRRGMGLDAVPRVRVETPAPPVLGKETAGLTSAREAQAFPPSPSDRKSTRLNSSHQIISYAVFCLKKKIKQKCNLMIR